MRLLGGLAGLLPALSCFGQSSHQCGNLLHLFCGSLPGVSGHRSPSSYFVPDLLIFAFCLLGSNHQLQIRSPRGAVEIPDEVSNMLADPVKVVVSEVLLDL